MKPLRIGRRNRIFGYYEMAIAIVLRVAKEQEFERRGELSHNSGIMPRRVVELSRPRELDVIGAHIDRDAYHHK
jgi:hypothetical protein